MIPQSRPGMVVVMAPSWVDYTDAISRQCDMTLPKPPLKPHLFGPARPRINDGHNLTALMTTPPEHIQ